MPSQRPRSRFALLTTAVAASLLFALASGVPAVPPPPPDPPFLERLEKEVAEFTQAIREGSNGSPATADVGRASEALVRILELFRQELASLHQQAIDAKIEPCDRRRYEDALAGMDALLEQVNGLDRALADQGSGAADDPRVRFVAAVRERTKGGAGQVASEIRKARAAAQAHPESCGEPEKVADAVPPTVEAGGKSKDQMRFANARTGEDIPAEEVTLRQVRSDPATERAETPPPGVTASGTAKPQAAGQNVKAGTGFFADRFRFVGELWVPTKDDAIEEYGVLDGVQDTPDNPRWTKVSNGQYKVFSEIPDGALVGTDGCGPCIGVIILTPDRTFVFHFNSLDDPYATLSGLGPFPDGSRAVIFGGEDGARASRYTLEQVMEGLQGVKDVDFYDGDNLFVDNKGTFYRTPKYIPGSLGGVMPDDPAPRHGDDDAQAEVDGVRRNGMYVMDAPCKAAQVVQGSDLIDADVVRLQPKATRLQISYCTELDDRARDVLRRWLESEQADPDLDSYDITIQRGVQRVGPTGPGTGLEVPYCIFHLRPRTPRAAARVPACTPPVSDDGAQISGDPPPPAQDDPSTDPFDGTPPQKGTAEKEVPSGPDKPLAPPLAGVNHGPGAANAPGGPFPDDPFFRSRGTWGQAYADQWGLHRIGFSPEGSDRSTSLWPAAAQPVVVAVIDTGVDRLHPDLQGAIWINRDEIAANGIDDDANGYVDDVYGWNFAGEDNDTMDYNGHGTVVAGIIGAWLGNATGIAGINPWSRIMPVKVTTWSGASSNFEIASAIRYAVDNGARVINLSYGGRHLRWTEYLAIAYARQKGVIVVAAAGNEAARAETHSPGGLPGVVTVAATGVEDNRLGFSNWGPGVDVAAPGWDILSLRARGTDLLKWLRDDYVAGSVIVGDDRRYYRLTGTSFAVPFVSGVASLILSVRPELTDTQVMRMVLHSARDIETPGWDQYTGYGLLDARAALKADPDFFVLARILGVSGRETARGTILEVAGRARADRFRRAWIEMGRGENPTDWVKVSEDLTTAVDGGPLAQIPAGRFQGGAEWTLRLVVEHESGARREARFKLTLR